MVETFPTLAAILTRTKFGNPADMVPGLRRNGEIEFRSEPVLASRGPFREQADLPRGAEKVSVLRGFTIRKPSFAEIILRPQTKRVRKIRPQMLFQKRKFLVYQLMLERFGAGRDE